MRGDPVLLRFLVPLLAATLLGLAGAGLPPEEVEVRFDEGSQTCAFESESSQTTTYLEDRVVTQGSGSSYDECSGQRTMVGAAAKPQGEVLGEASVGSRNTYTSDGSFHWDGVYRSGPCPDDAAATCGSWEQRREDTHHNTRTSSMGLYAWAAPAGPVSVDLERCAGSNVFHDLIQGEGTSRWDSTGSSSQAVEDVDWEMTRASTCRYGAYVEAADLEVKRDVLVCDSEGLDKSSGSRTNTEADGSSWSSGTRAQSWDRATRCGVLQREVAVEGTGTAADGWKAAAWLGNAERGREACTSTDQDEVCERELDEVFALVGARAGPGAAPLVDEEREVGPLPHHRVNPEL